MQKHFPNLTKLCQKYAQQPFIHKKDFEEKEEIFLNTAHACISSWLLHTLLVLKIEFDHMRCRAHAAFQ